MPYNIHQLEFFFTHKIWFINEEKFSPVKKYAFIIFAIGRGLG